MRKYFLYMTILGIVEISLSLYLTFWRESFWNFISERNVEGFITYLGIFTVIALSFCIITASFTYAANLAAIKWRQELNQRALLLSSTKLENVNQRIQQDCSEYPTLVIQLGAGLLKASIYIIVFSTTLIYEFNYIYLTIIATYAIVSTYIAKRIGNPLIAINYKSQQVEATYRNKLNPSNFDRCIVVMYDLARKLKHLQYFQILYSQLGIIIPLLIAAPAYFAAKLTLGSLMQLKSLMETIVDNMSYGINNYDVINRLMSSRKRLTELGVL